MQVIASQEQPEAHSHEKLLSYVIVCFIEFTWTLESWLPHNRLARLYTKQIDYSTTSIAACTSSHNICLSRLHKVDNHNRVLRRKTFIGLSTIDSHLATPCWLTVRVVCTFPALQAIIPDSPFLWAAPGWRVMVCTELHDIWTHLHEYSLQPRPHVDALCDPRHACNVR